MNQPILNMAGVMSAAAWLLAACATGSGPNVGGNWQLIGAASSSNIQHAIDTASIIRQGNLATFRDKKTVVDMKRERFSATPAYKVAVGTWEIDCARKTFRLTALQLLDESGRTVSQNQYSASQMRPMAVMRGSASEQQYQRVCGQAL